MSIMQGAKMFSLKDKLNALEAKDIFQEVKVEKVEVKKQVKVKKDKKNEK